MRVSCCLLILIVFFGVSILLFFGIIEWYEAITLIILAITAVVVGIEAFATAKMAEYQLMPALDINMVYENSEKRTYFWFSNLSNFPAVVSFNLTKRGGNKKCLHTQSFRIPAQRKMCTMAIAFFEPNMKEEFKPIEGQEVVLNTCIGLAHKNPEVKYEFKKEYRFHEYPDKSNFYRWDEITFGFPDPSWPGD